MPTTRKRVTAAKEKTNISIDVSVTETDSKTDEAAASETEEVASEKTAEKVEDEVEDITSTENPVIEITEDEVEPTTETADPASEENIVEEAQTEDVTEDAVEETIETDAEKTEEVIEDKEVAEESTNVEEVEEDSAKKAETEVKETAKTVDAKVNIKEDKVEADKSTDDAAIKKEPAGDIITISDKKDDKKAPATVKVEEDSEPKEASVTSKKQYESMAEFLADNPHPKSLAKLRQLTVNIGPIKPKDLMSLDLFNILQLNYEFEIKFSLRDKENSDGTVKKEKLGFVRIPFTIRSPFFLIKVANALGSLHIDGRDMSVKFPEAFNTTLEECKVYCKKEAAANVEVKKYIQKIKERQIVVKNVPANTDVETIQSLFPEANSVTMNTVKAEDGSQKLGSVTLDFNTLEECKKCFEINKDVQIGDSKVQLIKFYTTKVVPKKQGQLRGRGGATRWGNNAWGRGGTTGFGRGQFMNVKSRMADMKKKQPFVSARGGRGRGVMSGSLMGAGPRKNISQGGYQNQSPQMGARKGRGGNNTQFGSSPGNVGRQYQARNQMVSPNRSQMVSPNRNQQFNFSPQGASNRARQSSDEDPVAMMHYLKNTLARMEEKITHTQSRSDVGNRGDDFDRNRRYSGDGGFNRMQSSTQSSYGRDKSFQSSGGGSQQQRGGSQQYGGSQSQQYGGSQTQYVQKKRGNKRKNSMGGGWDQGGSQQKKQYTQQQQQQYSGQSSSGATIWDSYDKYTQSLGSYNSNQGQSSGSYGNSGGSYYGSGSGSQQSSNSNQQIYGQSANFW